MTQHSDRGRQGRWILLAIPLLVLPLLVVTGAGFPSGPSQDHSYVGVDGCKMCHRNPAKGNQFGQWEGTLHAKAFEVLATDKAKEIAQDKGVGDPQQADNCLECHVTGHGGEKAATYKVEQGVGCESCHGPGSAFKAIPIMRDQAKAIENGLIVPDEQTCLKCHNDKSPTYEGFNFEEMWKLVQHPDPTKG